MEGSPFTGHTDWVTSIAFSHDGQRIVSGSSDDTIRVWNAAAGELEGIPFIGHTHAVNSVAFSQDGQRIVSGSSDFTIRVWNAIAAERDREDFTEQTMMYIGGWMCGSKGEHVVRIPQIHRASLLRPSNVWIAGGHLTQLDLSRFVHGPKWTTVISK